MITNNNTLEQLYSDIRDIRYHNLGYNCIEYTVISLIELPKDILIMIQDNLGYPVMGYDMFRLCHSIEDKDIHVYKWLSYNTSN